MVSKTVKPNPSDWNNLPLNNSIGQQKLLSPYHFKNNFKFSRILSFLSIAGGYKSFKCFCK